MQSGGRDEGIGSEASGEAKDALDTILPGFSQNR